jgi:hypothetical protein
MRAFSFGKPNHRAEAPEAMINVRVSILCPLTVSLNDATERSAAVTSPAMYSVPNRAAWSFMR